LRFPKRTTPDTLAHSCKNAEIAVLGPEGGFVSINNGGEFGQPVRLHGYTCPDYVGQIIGEVVTWTDKTDLPSAKKRITAILEGKAPNLAAENENLRRLVELRQFNPKRNQTWKG